MTEVVASAVADDGRDDRVEVEAGGDDDGDDVAICLFLNPLPFFFFFFFFFFFERLCDDVNSCASGRVAGIVQKREEMERERD